MAHGKFWKLADKLPGLSFSLAAILEKEAAICVRVPTPAGKHASAIDSDLQHPRANPRNGSTVARRTLDVEGLRRFPQG